MRLGELVRTSSTGYHYRRGANGGVCFWGETSGKRRGCGSLPLRRERRSFLGGGEAVREWRSVFGEERREMRRRWKNVLGGVVVVLHLH